MVREREDAGGDFNCVVQLAVAMAMVGDDLSIPSRTLSWNSVFASFRPFAEYSACIMLPFVYGWLRCEPDGESNGERGLGGFGDWGTDALRDPDDWTLGWPPPRLSEMCWMGGPFMFATSMWLRDLEPGRPERAAEKYEM